MGMEPDADFLTARRREYALGVQLLVTGSILWGVGTVFRQPVLRNHEAGPVTISYAISIVASVTMGIILGRRLREVWGWYKKRPVLNAFLGVLQFGGTVFTYIAMQDLSLSTVSMLTQMQPIFTIVFASILLREHFPIRMLPYAGLAVIAAMFVVVPDPRTFSIEPDDVYALCMLILSVALAGLWVVCTKLALTPKDGGRSVPTDILAMISFLSALIFFTVLHPFVCRTNSMECFACLTMRAWLVVIGTGSLSTVVALLLFFRGQGHGVSASVSGLVQLLNPLTCVIGGILFLGDVVTWSQCLGMGMLLFSTRMISLPRNRR